MHEGLYKELRRQNYSSLSKIMPKSKAKRIVQKYAQMLKAADYPFHAIYLFGSQVMGKMKAWSDIDVAVVSDKLKKMKTKTDSCYGAYGGK